MNRPYLNKKYLFLGVLLIVGLLFFYTQNLMSKDKQIDYEDYVNEIVRSYAKESQKEYDNLIFVGDGGRMPYDVEEISVKFHCYKRMSIAEARKLEVELTEKLLKKINNHKKIRPFLRVYPFESSRVDVMLHFENPEDGRRCTGENVALLFQARGNLCYFNSNDKEELLDLHQESYKEAYKIVMGDKEQ